MLDPTYSRQRQQRLLPIMAHRRLDAIVVGLPHHVQYLSAFRPGWLHEAAFVLFADGRSWLATANSPAKATAADEVVSFEANRHSTLRQDQPASAADLAVFAMKTRRAQRIGIDASAVSSQVALSIVSGIESIDENLWPLRRQKDPDELALIQTAIRCAEAMYRRAKEIIEPGLPELKMFTELNAAAIHTAGEPMTALLGNDYACGVGGGAARNQHVAGAGQLYILDLGPTYRGYFADTCRAFAVDRQPTDAQQKAADALVGALALVEKIAKPGVRCQDIYAAVDEHLKSTTGTGMTHHLGHGIGLQPHEYPHLNPKWDDTLLEGEVFTAEPGLYGPHLNGGIRLENDYLVTNDGVRNLVNFPLSL